MASSGWLGEQTLWQSGYMRWNGDIYIRNIERSSSSIRVQGKVQIIGRGTQFWYANRIHAQVAGGSDRLIKPNTGGNITDGVNWELDFDETISVSPSATSATISAYYHDVQTPSWVNNTLYWTINFNPGRTYNYYLHYYANGGSGAPVGHSYENNPNQSYTFTIRNERPYRSGYTFLGWSKSSYASSPSYSPGDGITATSSEPELNLYAVWHRDTVYYNYYGSVNDSSMGSISPTSGSAEEDSTVTFYASPATYHGVKAWEVNGSTYYTDSTSRSVTIDRTRYVKVIFHRTHGKRFTILKHSNFIDGTDPIFPQISDYQADYGYTMRIEGNPPTQEGFIFRGWADEKNAITPKYQHGDSYTFTGEETQKELWAVWEREPNRWRFNASVEPASFGEISPTAGVQKEGAPIQFIVTPKNGDFVVEKWVINGEEIITSDLSKTVTLTQDTTIKAFLRSLTTSPKIKSANISSTKHDTIHADIDMETWGEGIDDRELIVKVYSEDGLSGRQSKVTPTEDLEYEIIVDNTATPINGLKTLVLLGCMGYKYEVLARRNDKVDTRIGSNVGYTAPAPLNATLEPITGASTVTYKVNMTFNKSQNIEGARADIEYRYTTDDNYLTDWTLAKADHDLSQPLEFSVTGVPYSKDSQTKVFKIEIRQKYRNTYSIPQEFSDNIPIRFVTIKLYGSKDGKAKIIKRQLYVSKDDRAKRLKFAYGSAEIKARRIYRKK